MLWSDGPPGLVHGAARQRGSRPLLSALFPGLRAQLIQRLLDPGQLANQSAAEKLNSFWYQFSAVRGAVCPEQKSDEHSWKRLMLMPEATAISAAPVPDSGTGGPSPKLWFKSLFSFLQGCYEKVEEWLDENKHLLGTIAMCVLVIQVGVVAVFTACALPRVSTSVCRLRSQLLGMAFSMTLYQQIHRTGKKYEAWRLTGAQMLRKMLALPRVYFKCRRVYRYALRTASLGQYQRRFL